MEQHFSEDRERELSRMRSLPPTPPPPPAGATSGGPPPPPMPDDVPALGGESEKTVIFAGEWIWWRENGTFRRIKARSFRLTCWLGAAKRSLE